MKINKLFLPILLFSGVALGIVIGKYMNRTSSELPLKKNYKAKINQLISFIDNEYVDDVKTDSIVDLTVSNILANLDPHSVYVPKAEQNLVAENMHGNFVGIGINFYNYNDTIAVINPIKNGPAYKAGIKPGDRILYADNHKIFGKNIDNDTLYKRLRGEENSPVTLTVVRKPNKKPFKVKLIRAKIPLKSVDIAVLLNKNTGYIKINRFAENTGTEFHKALEVLKTKNIQNLVVDLRENGGGIMESAIEIADEFLKDKELIVFTKSKNGAVEKTFATSDGSFETGKVAVLIDENSASASEILAGAIQDNDRGTVYGRRSFGKGLVQREMNFEDGSAVRLTVARYFTPSGRSIQKPYKKGDAENYYKEWEHRFETGELYEKDKIKIADSLKFKTKKGRIVFGGGGIVPDVFVPLEANKGNEQLEYYLQSGIVGHFVFEIIDSNRNLYNNLTKEKFLKENSSKDFSVKFQKYLDTLGLKLTVATDKNLVNRYITAEFAKQLFGETEYYKMLLKEDKMVRKALD